MIDDKVTLGVVRTQGLISPVAEVLGEVCKTKGSELALDTNLSSRPWCHRTEYAVATELPYHATSLS